jgi:2,4-dienoyl-CoA reductase-like NADH-dependent reductase (Old Yellow Enzyme family)
VVFNADDSALVRPLSIGGLVLPGRLFKSATAETRASVDGFVTDDLLNFYEPMARGGTPLIVTGALAITPEAGGLFREVSIDSDERIAGLRELTEVVHRHGSKLFAQLNHCGRQILTQPDPVSASAVRERTFGIKPRPLSVAEIRQLVQDFAAAAERAQRAGFDGVELHMAHGYLVSQFLTPHTNRRSDEYGGSPDRRRRFALEILRAVRERVGPDFPVIAKLNGHDHLARRDGLETSDLAKVARNLQEEGLDAVEITACHYESGGQHMRGRFFALFRGWANGMCNELPPLRRVGMKVSWPVIAAVASVRWPYREGFNLEYARQFTDSLSIPVICGGGWQHREQIEQAIDGGGCDAVSAARAFIADPLLFRHLSQAGAPAPECSRCNACLGRLSHQPVDCYDPDVRARRDAVLRDEIDWLHPQPDMRGPKEMVVK